MGRLDSKSVTLLFFISFLALLSYFFDKTLMSFIKTILEKGYFKNLLLMIISVVVISHMIRVNSKTKSSIFMFRSGFPVIDSVLNWATYYSVTSTACVLLEGAYLQKFYNIQYYTKFNGLDINVMLGVCALLLWYVSLHIFKMGQELLFKPEEVVIAAETGTQSEITQ